MEYKWNSSYDYDAAFQKIKEAVTADTTLRYFETAKPVVVQVNASQTGLGAALLQDGKPVAYASRALNDTESHYANNECEMLAIVFGAEKFHTFVYGQPFLIESDHKPLEAIAQKKLADTPARLQRMLLCIQGYDYTLQYKPGKEMLIADALSQYDPLPGSNIEMDVTIHHLWTIGEEQKVAFQQEVATNLTMKALMEMILEGWPDDVKQVPTALREYWLHWATLCVEDGLILKDENLVIWIPQQ